MINKSPSPFFVAHQFRDIGGVRGVAADQTVTPDLQELAAFRAPLRTCSSAPPDRLAANDHSSSIHRQVVRPWGSPCWPPPKAPSRCRPRRAVYPQAARKARRPRRRRTRSRRAIGPTTETTVASRPSRVSSQVASSAVRLSAIVKLSAWSAVQSSRTAATNWPRAGRTSRTSVPPLASNAFNVPLPARTIPPLNTIDRAGPNSPTEFSRTVSARSSRRFGRCRRRVRDRRWGWFRSWRSSIIVVRFFLDLHHSGAPIAPPLKHHLAQVPRRPPRRRDRRRRRLVSVLRQRVALNCSIVSFHLDRRRSSRGFCPVPRRRHAGHDIDAHSVPLRAATTHRLASGCVSPFG